MTIMPVIMCGGAGTRLWPASRDSRPKHLLPLFEGLSTLQLTLLRFAGQDGFGRPTLVTNVDQRFHVAEQAAKIGVDTDIILEPMRRDSAAAVAVGALHAAEQAGDALCLMLAADHRVGDAAAFLDGCRRAAAGARAGLIMTLGIAPTGPATAYGYIQPGDAVLDDCRRVAAFHEKPDAATAARYVAAGHFWNSGNFLFEPAVMLGELDRHAPGIGQAAARAYAAASRDPDFIRLDPAAFAEAPQRSIDHAVMEKTVSAGVLACDCGWSDIGTWDALWEVLPRDESGNNLQGDAITLDCRDCLVHGDGLLAAAVGVENLVIVAQRDAVLVTTLDKAASVKGLVERLKQDGRAEATRHLDIPLAR